MQKNKRTIFDTRTLVFVGLLVAMHTVLTRLLVIEIGSSYRITLGSVCTILAGMWFGPLAGGLTGLVADILGCMLKGYAVNPLITVAAVLWGVIPALLCRFAKGGRVRKIVVICAAVTVTSVLSSLVFTTIGVALLNGGDFFVSVSAILPGRLIQWAIMTPVYCVLTFTLYFSPLTSLVKNGTVHQVKDTAKA